MALRNTELPLDVIWPRLIAIADEMATTMFRTAFSHDVVEVHDMSTGLLDDRGHLMAQTWLGATGHTGCMPAFGANLVEAFPPENVNPGDVFICNDPWLCNGQTADVFITTPAFHKGKLIGFSVNTIHHVDIGGRKGSGLSEEVFEEGLIIPMLRLYDAGEPNEMLFDLIRRNVRYSEKMIGDLRAQVATGWAGCRELERLCAEFDFPDLREVSDEITGRTEEGIRAGLRELPDGEWREEMMMDIDGIDEPQPLVVTVKIEGDQLYADFTGTAPQVRRPVNCPINFSRAYVAVPVKMICDPSLPNNQGTYRPITLTAPEGSLLNPSYPAACFWRLSAGMLVAELMFKIFSRIVPDRVPAESGSLPTWQFYVTGNKPDGEAYALHQHSFGGMGGRPGADGLSAVSFPYNVRDVSIEWSEHETPILYHARELIPDSGGPGASRGGLGQELIFEAYEPGTAPKQPLVFAGAAGRMRFPPQGLGGGKPGALAEITRDGQNIAPSSSPEFPFEVGEVVHLKLPGGGGHGDPAERDAAEIDRDLKAGYITEEGAKRDYGRET
ncbi:MAG: hydantoinase B/oxoprolinase family protein [Alphaproteobacteria bacterium]|nr:hydantoinase B/oxoprolinase family protein [Alphaproteobacteria bacterium]